jgi:hypothetical protein
MNSPYKTTSTSAMPNLSMDVGSQITRYKEEEKYQKAPPIQPYTLDSTKEIISAMYGKLSDLRKAVNQTASQSNVNKSALAAINGILENIGKEILMDIPEQLDKLNL